MPRARKPVDGLDLAYRALQLVLERMLVLMPYLESG